MHITPKIEKVLINSYRCDMLLLLAFRWLDLNWTG